MADFSQDISNFQRYGAYTYKFDSVGNMTFDSSSANFNQVYLAFPLQNVLLKDSKVQTFYNTSFEEFVPEVVAPPTVSNENLQQQLDQIQSENDTLKSQLDSLIVQSESSGSNIDQIASKQVVLELRKALGQGRVESDFSEDFPYTPIRKEKT